MLFIQHLLIPGKSYMNAYHIWPLSQGYSNVYLDTFDPRVTNEFAAAAFRFGHSLIPHSFQSGRLVECSIISEELN